MAGLDKLHAKHVLPGFTDRTAEEREIERQTNDITRVSRGVHHLSDLHAVCSRSRTGLPQMLYPHHDNRTRAWRAARRDCCGEECAAGIGAEGADCQLTVPAQAEGVHAE